MHCGIGPVSRDQRSIYSLLPFVAVRNHQLLKQEVLTLKGMQLCSLASLNECSLKLQQEIQKMSTSFKVIEEAHCLPT
jgi:hypothetical protein